MFGSAVLDQRGVRPGSMAAGHVHLGGGRGDVTADGVAVALLTVVSGVEVDFLRCQVAAGVSLAAGRSRGIPFEQAVPWETPCTQVGGEALPLVAVRLRTTVTVGGVEHEVGVTPVTVHPTAGQWRVLAALRQLGWRLDRSEVRQGSVPGVRQSDPFLQWFECSSVRVPDPLRLAFVANPVGVDVLLDTGPAGRHRFAVRHTADDPLDVAALLEDRLHLLRTR